MDTPRFDDSTVINKSQLLHFYTGGENRNETIITIISLTKSIISITVPKICFHLIKFNRRCLNMTCYTVVIDINSKILPTSIYSPR